MYDIDKEFLFKNKPVGGFMYVEVRGDSLGDLDRALRQFSKQVKKAEIVNEVKRREFYVKRSKKKILKRQEALRRRIREEKKVEKKKNTEW
jgi:ribosomal protein S21